MRNLWIIAFSLASSAASAQAAPAEEIGGGIAGLVVAVGVAMLLRRKRR